MSHPTDWTCRSCRAVLGQVCDGVLRPTVPVESVDGRGVARLPCQRCGRVKAWGPDGDNRPTDVLGPPADRTIRSEGRADHP